MNKYKSKALQWLIDREEELRQQQAAIKLELARRGYKEVKVDGVTIWRPNNLWGPADD